MPTDAQLKSIIDWAESVNFGPIDPSSSAMPVALYPTSSVECMAKIDAGFGIDAAKTVACNTFLLANDPNVLDAMANTAAAANQPIYSGWCKAKAAYIRGGGGGTCVPKTCAQVGASCGQTPDGCNGTLNCGGCIQTEECIGNQCKPKQSPNGVYPDLPKDNAECLANIDKNMTLTMKVSTCKELFDPKNSADTLLGFSSDAEKAGYPIASLWFYQQSKQLSGKTDETQEKDYTVYYVAGGIAALALVGITIGALAAK